MVSLVDSMTGDHPMRAALVLSNVAQAGGLQKAADRGVATTVVDHKPFGKDRAAFEDALNDALQDIDLICLAGFMRILTPAFTQKWAGRMLNIHPSLLPKYTGLNTHARAIAAGDNWAGCSVHKVTAVLDDGPILGQGRVLILPDDTPQSLAARVLEIEHQLYPAALRRFADGTNETVKIGF